MSLTSVGLCATRVPIFGLVAHETLVLLHTVALLLSLPSARPVRCFIATLSTLEDCFTAAALLLLAAFCRASKRFSICWAGVM